MRHHDQQEHQEQHGQQGEQQERLPFALLVGADGRQSTVRQQIPSAYLPQETFDLAPFVPAGSAAARRVRVPGLSQTTVRIGHDSGTAHTSYIPAPCSSVIVPCPTTSTSDLFNLTTPQHCVRRQVILAYELTADGSCPELARNAEGEHLDPFDPGVYVPGVTSGFKRFFPP